MKILVLVLFCVSSVQGDLGRRTESIEMVENYLSMDASLQDKAKGLSFAKQYDNFAINEALVTLLDDKSLGGRISQDEGIEMPWIEAMHLLAKRFPEANVDVNIDYRYTEEDKSKFIKWWSENKDKIEYRNDTHVLIHNSLPQPTTVQPSQPLINPDDERNLEGTSPESSDLGLMPATEFSPDRETQEASTPKTLSEQNSKPANNSNLSSSKRWPLVAGVIVVGLGLLWAVLKLRK